MKLTNDNAFIDTNILVYCYDANPSLKKERAIELTKNIPSLFISTQVVQELACVMSKKYNTKWNVVLQTIEELKKDFSIAVNSINTVVKACAIADKYKFSFYDSLIIAAALECNCKILYSEDLQNKQIIENSLMVINPFL
jgi:predicted nucleic acid-binding protein